MQFSSICVYIFRSVISVLWVFLIKKYIFQTANINNAYFFLSIRKDNKYYDTSQMQNELEFLFWYSMICMNITLSCFINNFSWNTMKPQFEILNVTFSRSLTVGTLSYSSALSDIFKLVSIYGLLFAWDNEILKPNP